MDGFRAGLYVVRRFVRLSQPVRKADSDRAVARRLGVFRELTESSPAHASRRNANRKPVTLGAVTSHR
ncbi:unnamed protein product, partial [Iphiclides podalirius]